MLQSAWTSIIARGPRTLHISFGSHRTVRSTSWSTDVHIRGSGESLLLQIVLQICAPRCKMRVVLESRHIALKLYSISPFSTI